MKAARKESKLPSGDELSWRCVLVLELARKLSGMTLREASESLGRKSPTFVKDIESGRYSKLSLGNAADLSKLYRVRLSTVLEIAEATDDLGVMVEMLCKEHPAMEPYKAGVLATL